jgi:hypothetical protein
VQRLVLDFGLPAAGDENRKLTTLNGGSLGSWVDEGRCKMRADM